MSAKHDNEANQSLQQFADRQAARLASMSSFKNGTHGFGKLGRIRALRSIEREAAERFEWMDDAQAMMLARDIRDMADLIVCAE
jgi:hypothetical protein